MSSLWVDMSLHTNTFRANQSLLLLVNVAWLTEKQQIHFYSLWFDSIEVRTTIYCTRGEHDNYYTTDVICNV